MTFVPLSIDGTYMIQLARRSDERGSFLRVFCSRELQEIGLRKNIVQINRSLSTKRGSIRGMHYQAPPRADAKLVSCLNGSVYDVLVDLRKGSRSFLCWHAEVLRADLDRMLYVPEGVAHGFQTLEHVTELLYLHTEYFSPPHDAGFRYDDPRIAIRWPLPPTEISVRDTNQPLLGDEFEGIVP